MTPDFVWHAANVHTQKHTLGSVVSPRATHFLYSFFFFFLSCGGWWALIGGGGRGFFLWSGSLAELCLSAYKSGDGAERRLMQPTDTPAADSEEGEKWMEEDNWP